MSIFSKQLHFQPLSPERRKLLHKELIVYLSAIVLLVSLPTLHYQGLEFQRWLNHLVEPFTSAWTSFITHFVLAPLSLWIKQCHFDWHFDWTILQPIARSMKFLGFALHDLIFVVVLPLAPLILLVAVNSGIFGIKQSKDSSVLSEELRRWTVLRFEPRVIIHLQQHSIWKELVGSFLLFLTAYLTLFFVFSGVVATAVPLWVVRATDVGMTNWLIACLSDAHMHFLHRWVEYGTAMNNVVRPEPHHHIVWNQYFQNAPMSYTMPADLVKFRLFVAAFISVFAAVPFTLSMIAVGLDSLSSSTLKLTPTRLIKVRRYLYFFWDIHTWRWSQLVSVSKESGSDKYVLSFANCKTRQFKVSFADLSEADQKLFLQALAELAVSCEFSKEVNDALALPDAQAPKGYTLFWEDALRSKRKSTVFVPLAEGALLGAGRIKIVRQLAGQGWAATYLARLGEDLIVVRESHMSDETEAATRAGAMLQRESVVLSGLKHDGIATVLDHFVENGRSYLILEYVAGRDLRQHLELSGPLSESATVEIALKLCHILQYLHSQDPPIIHRDISPDNIVRTESTQLKLIDFGACKQFVENATGTIVGKQAFMAPEQLRGKAVAQSDIYSLGATMHFLLTGKDPVALTECHPRAGNEMVSEELDALIARMTSFEQAERPASVSEVRDRLMAIRGQAKEVGVFVKLTNKMNSIRLRTAEKLRTETVNEH